MHRVARPIAYCQLLGMAVEQGQTLPAAVLTGERPADWPPALCTGGYEHDPARMTITGRQPPTRSTWPGQPAAMSPAKGQNREEKPMSHFSVADWTLSLFFRADTDASGPGRRPADPVRSI
jgi:hypothetical protein